MTAFNLPDLGEGLQEAELVAWHVAEGDHVVLDQPLVSVETEKAVVEIPSPKSGHIARLLARPGERVKVGAPLLLFEGGHHADAGTVVGTLQPSQPTASAIPTTVASPAKAAPAVRARAKDLGIDLSRIAPSGPDGTVTLADLERAASGHKPALPRSELTGARRTMAANMARAWREVVHATLYEEADIEAWTTQKDVTVRLIRALIAGCGAEPSLNASFDAATPSLQPSATIDIGLAIEGPDGLFVPVLRAVERTDEQDWRSRIDAAKLAVAHRRLSPADLRNPTITLSNFGTIAGRHAALIIVPPQVAILGAGRIFDRAVRDDGGLISHRMLPLSLTFDHRAVTGAQAARFVAAIIADLERPF